MISSLDFWINFTLTSFAARLLALTSALNKTSTLRVLSAKTNAEDIRYSEIESITQFAPQYYKFSVKMPQWNAAGRYNIIIYAIKRAIVANAWPPLKQQCRFNNARIIALSQSQSAICVYHCTMCIPNVSKIELYCYGIELNLECGCVCLRPVVLGMSRHSVRLCELCDRIAIVSESIVIIRVDHAGGW